MHSISLENHLDEVLSVEKKDLDNLLKRLSTKQKKLKNSYSQGDLSGITESLTGLLEEYENSLPLLKQLADSIGGFPLTSYLDEAFDECFRSALKKESIHVRGEYPAYEVFPFVVKISSKEGVAFVNKKKVRGLRIRYLVNLIKKERDRFFKSSFKSYDFLKDVAKGYDMVIASKKAKQTSKAHDAAIEEAPVPILDVYKVLTPMKRQKKDYPTQLFGFDIYRLLQEEINNPKASIIIGEDGARKCLFGSTRIGKRNGITVVEESGRETTFGSIKFVKVEAENNDADTPLA